MRDLEEIADRTDAEIEEIDDLLARFEDLEQMADDPEEQRMVRKALHAAIHASQPRLLGRVVKGFDRRDMAEAFIGSLVFGIPMIVEGGTQEIAAFTAENPLSFAFTALFGVGLIIGILYFSDLQDVRVTNPVLGIIPRRVVGVTGVAFLTAAVLLTVWGRVDWQTPWLALNNVVVTFAVMGIGSALGDILPGT